MKRFALFANALHIVLLMTLLAPSSFAGKPKDAGGGNGGGGSDGGGGDPPPVTVSFHYEVTWLAATDDYSVKSELTLIDCNNHGVMVGYRAVGTVFDPTGFIATKQGVIEAEEYIGGFTALPEGYPLVMVVSINDAGQLLCMAREGAIADGNFRLYRFTPPLENPDGSIAPAALEYLPESGNYAGAHLLENGDVVYVSALTGESVCFPSDGSQALTSFFPTAVEDVSQLGQFIVNDDSGCYLYESLGGGDFQLEHYFSRFAANCLNDLGEIGARATGGRFALDAYRLNGPDGEKRVADEANCEAINSFGDIAGTLKLQHVGYFPYIDTLDYGFLDLDNLVVGEREKWNAALSLNRLARYNLAITERVDLEIDGQTVSAPIICGSTTVQGLIGGELPLVYETFILNPVP
ncbi:hypothetical protein FYK55_17995 [Roseiconus nitratireducens]|uniref:Phytase-like domain-containing protein n=1 Tax=Roseiconus nitratireducens TaxID=2605748 RepID=A0A5M6D3J9_9BACT|nr:hypothetical protein [Roseiconus nitratireducens]KAA5541456.1 hypothetical protein FYK55_17995 [Roseiconus nitratireducens]